MKVGICGLGLIGSSVARGLLPGHQVLGWDPDPGASAVLADLGIQPVAAVADLRETDLVLLAAPTGANVDTLRQLRADPSWITPVADLGSVKGPIVAEWSTDPGFPFVATHPMAGSELSGAAAGRADLFRGSSWAVVVEPRTDPRAVSRMVSVIVTLGAEVVPVSADQHDRLVARVSHLPHLMAGVLGQLIADESDLALRLAAGSFRDSTRVCASPADRTAEFVSTNATEAAAAARDAAELLTQVADQLVAPELVESWLEVGRDMRRRFDAGPAAVDPVPITDDLGLLALLLDRRDTGFALIGRTDSRWLLTGGNRP